jgi:hypothetical protein
MVAVHEQVAPVITINDGAGLPNLFTEAPDELREYVQIGGGAA